MRNGRTGAGIAGRGVWPARVEALRRRFELWRRARTGREPIPEELWAAAVKLAAMRGLSRMAQALGLNYTALKDRVEATDPAGRKTGDRMEWTDLQRSRTRRVPARAMPVRRVPTPESPPATPRIVRPLPQKPVMTFVELPPAEGIASRISQRLSIDGTDPVPPACLIELEHPRGAKMRIHITGSPSPEVVTALGAAFFRAEASSP